MSDPDRIFLEPDHDQIEGRCWCQDDDPASLGEPWTEYVRADLYAELRHEAGEWVEVAERATDLADAATALASQYLRERDRYREALERSCTGTFNPIWEKSGKLFTCRDKHNNPEMYEGYGLGSPCPACAALLPAESEE